MKTLLNALFDYQPNDPQGNPVGPRRNGAMLDFLAAPFPESEYSAFANERDSVARGLNENIMDTALNQALEDWSQASKQKAHDLINGAFLDYQPNNTAGKPFGPRMNGAMLDFLAAVDPDQSTGLYANNRDSVAHAINENRLPYYIDWSNQARQARKSS